MKSHKTLAIPSLLGAFLSIALFGLLIAGCGSASAGATPPTSFTPTVAALQKCGAVGVMRSRPVAGVANAAKPDVAGNCFWQAYQQCQSASLTVNFGGVDTITTHNFTLQKKNTSCTISDTVQSRIVPRPAKTTGTYTCTGIVNTTSELRINGCGTFGSIVVPTNQIGNPK